MSRLIVAENIVAPAAPATGKVIIYAKSDGNMYYKGDDGVEHPFGTPSDLSKTLVVEAPDASEDITYFFTDKALTITKIRPILNGSSTPSTTWTLRHDPDRSAVGNEVVTGGTVTTEVTTGVDITVFNDATIPANSWVWFETTAQSGTVEVIALTTFYDED